MKLSELKTGETAVVVKVHGHGAFRRRVIEMGFVKGRPVTVVLHAPLQDPIKYSILGYEVSLRLAEAALIEVIRMDDADAAVLGSSVIMASPSEYSEIHHSFNKERHTIDVALIGNPNCGKTSLFNALSGAKEHVGNYSGVTVGAKDGEFHYGDYTINIIDLPGTYSLSCYSPEELYVRSYLREHTPDLILNVVDASNLERNLYLTTEIIDMDYSTVIALNMYDELRESGASLDYENLGKMIGVPMVPIVSKTHEGISNLMDTIIAVYENRDTTVRHVHVNLGADMEGAIRKLVDAIKASPFKQHYFSPRYLAIKLLEGDHQIEDEIPSLSRKTADSNPEDEKHCSRFRKLFCNCADCDKCAVQKAPHWRDNLRSGADDPILMMRDKLKGRIESLRDEDISSIVAAEKYGFIAGALAETYTPGKHKKKATKYIDKLATNRIIGFPLFFAVMFFIFWATFAIGQYPMDWIESGVTWLSGLVHQLMPEGILKDMIADGIIGGVGGVIVFLPNILILFFCISFMEDSGYMSRAAFIMDKVMHRIGLHGKSFIPLVMGFGCNVPAILASRSIESKSSRIITVLINPFMSCSARLPIYVLLVGTFFPGHATLVFAGIYFLGIAVAVLTARLLRRFYFHKDETPFVMELPPYRMPNLHTSLSHTWEKGRQYLKKMGGIILFASILVWALNYFPLNRSAVTPEQAAMENYDDSAIDFEHDSYLEMAGKAINPIMEPLGIKWRATVAALAGVPAKEIVVSTLGVLYTDNEEVSDSTLGKRLKAPDPSTGKPDFTPASALAFMIFILLYCPCVASITAIARESGSWRYAAFSIIYNTAVAWIVAFAAYQLMQIFQ